eukprot:2241021-Amphidinium_carterae.1
MEAQKQEVPIYPRKCCQLPRPTPATSFAMKASCSHSVHSVGYSQSVSLGVHTGIVCAIFVAMCGFPLPGVLSLCLGWAPWTPPTFSESKRFDPAAKQMPGQNMRPVFALMTFTDPL